MSIYVNFMSAEGGRWKVCVHDFDFYIKKIFNWSEKLSPQVAIFFYSFKSTL